MTTRVEWCFTVLYGMARKKAVEMLLRQPVDVNSKDRWGLTPLHYSAKGHSNENIIGMLMRKPVDVSMRDQNGLTTLHHAT